MIGEHRKVLVLQHAEVEKLGLYERVLRGGGSEPVYVRVHDGQPVPRDLEGYDGLIVLGGPMAVYEQKRYPHISEELKLIEKALHANKPLLGICLGCQMLCAALGGGVFRGERREIGWHEIELRAGSTEDEYFTMFPARFTAFHWHGDQCELPGYSTLLASSELTPVQAFSYGLSALGIQFHPEVDEAGVEGFTEAFAAELLQERISPASLIGGAALHIPAIERRSREAFANWWRSALSTVPQTLDSGMFPTE